MKDETLKEKYPWLGDPERNKRPESACNFKSIKDDLTGASLEQCDRCGRKRNLDFRV